MGRPVEITQKLIDAIPTPASEKLRSANNRNGISGSPRFADCHHTNTPKTTRPAAIIAHTPGAHWKLSPSWSAKTKANMPTAESAIPSRSSRCRCVGIRGI
ncbi:Uncharacterised protein [Mycobacteroides abscessus subsp. abscessus]|nr:Uncharacterised protein [Mycobacteroides abscessus subsp. abscessus]